MRAMILAAGYGTRLWPLTIDRAKPALPFMGRPLVGYVAEYLARHGCREIVVNLHHRPESVRAALGDGSRFGVRLTYVEEPTILGTSGALDNAREFFEDDTFIVINGKLATDIDLNAALRTHRETRALATLVLRANAARERYSVVDVQDGLVRGFGAYPLASDKAGDASRVSPTGKPSDNQRALNGDERSRGYGDPVEDTDEENSSRESHVASAPLMFTGIQILEPRIFDYIPRGVFSHSTVNVYPRAIECGETIAAHVAAGYWYELSTMRRYLDTSVALMHAEGRSVELGEGARIDVGADVSDAVLWEDASVEAGARVRGAILGARVRVRSGEVFEECAIVRAELIASSARPSKALEGELRGDNFVVKLSR
ncbi:MAG: mannose-phosphate guanylyltransferase [Acidobacteriota bacterium]|nr:mannose-phosphate guanylyltransferase [Acidobacteriota bacterium]